MSKKLRNDPEELYAGLAAYYAGLQDFTDDEKEVVGVDWFLAESRLMRELDDELRKRP